MGAILAGAPNSQIDSLTEFGRLLGIGYQLVDDLLGLYGDEAVLGKPVGGDMREGKQTMLIYEARRRATPAQLAQLSKNWGNPTASQIELGQIRQLVEATGARDYIAALAEDYRVQALTHLRTAKLSDPYASRLEQISRVCIQRVS